MGFRDLEPEQRDAASTLNQDAASRPQSAAHD